LQLSTLARVTSLCNHVEEIKTPALRCSACVGRESERYWPTHTQTDTNPRQSLDFRAGRPAFGRKTGVWCGHETPLGRGGGVVGLTKFGISACFHSRHSPGLSFARCDPCSELCHLQARAEATVRSAGLQRALVAPRQEMPNLYDLLLRIANPIALLRASQSPAGGAVRVVHGI
jgi:hypothetical protein